MGGRQVCVEPKYGDVFDHQAIVYEYANGVRVFGYCRDIPGCYDDNTNVVLGSKGRIHARSRGSRARSPGSKGPTEYYDVDTGTVRCDPPARRSTTATTCASTR